MTLTIYNPYNREEKYVLHFRFKNDEQNRYFLSSEHGGEGTGMSDIDLWNMVDNWFKENM